MTSDEFVKYYEPAFKRWFGISGRNYLQDNLVLELKDFDEILGMKLFSGWYQNPSSKDIPISKEEVNLLVALDSPHCHSILKVWRIRKGLE